MRPETAGTDGLSEELIRLAYLCQAGILSSVEFEAAKSRALGEYQINPAED
jgi:hypothetical protein